MKKIFKYALVAGTGYAIHAALNREEKVKSTMYVGPTGPTLRKKLMDTMADHMADHISSKIGTALFPEPVKPQHRGSRYARFNTNRESK